MKESTSESAHEIDAGWDEIVPEPATISVKPVQSLAPQVEEVDAGWELEPQSEPKHALERIARAPKTREMAAKHPEPVTPSHVALSKKARRDLQRSQRMHAAQRKAETKAKRKEQRRTDRARHEEADPVVQSVAPRAVKTKQKRPKKAPAASSAHLGAEARTSATPLSQNKAHSTTKEATPSAVSSTSSSRAETSPRGIVSRWWIAMIVLIVAAFVWRWIRR